MKKLFAYITREPLTFFTTVLTVLGITGQIVQGIIQDISAGKTLFDAILAAIIGGGIIAAVRPKVTPVDDPRL